MTTDYRIENDSMGALEVPSDALWGAQTQRAVNNFPVSGLRMSRQFIRALGLIKWAAASTNHGSGPVVRGHDGRGEIGRAGGGGRPA